jgi:hypothetical protein
VDAPEGEARQRRGELISENLCLACACASPALAEKMRKGGLEPKAPVEMIGFFLRQCCAVWHGMAPLGPPGNKPAALLTGRRLRADGG